MNNQLLLWYLSAHFIGDFYLQSPKMAERKFCNYKITLKHCFYYSVPFFCLSAISLLASQQSNGLLFFVIIISHCLIDIAKCFFEHLAFFKKLQPRWVYIVDQLAHLSIIVIGVNYFTPTTMTGSDNTLLIAKFVLFTLLVMKPSNITFKVIFSKYQFVSKKKQENQSNPIIEQKEAPETVDGAGALIGNFERLIMGIFLYLQQYAAVGLILTAKSITRYNKIANEPGFSEYYLIGTLYSLFVTLVLYVLLFLVVQ